jgi:Mg2+ and Co2+ transporter CorA
MLIVEGKHRYHNHAFLILTLQKLVRIVDPKQEAREAGSERSTTGLLRKMTGLGRIKDDDDDNGIESGIYPRRPTASFGRQPSGITITEVTDKHSLRTLQRFHASPNEARTEYMEKHSALSEKEFAAVAEQVSIFITSDNTVIAFFEHSADDVELPILTRLNSPSTILRQSCDASMVAQAIIDVIIDMAIPLQVAYADVIGDIELDVLTRPNIKQSKSLYILSSEIAKMRSFIQPIVTVINALRDHKIVMSGSSNQTREYSPGKDDLQDPSKGVIISPLTYVYLGDALDHCVLINENLLQIAKAADNMIDLIFNTIAARQNDVLQLLTNVTIVFLPMTFLTGYFGQNFQPFPELDQGITLL